LQTFLGPARDDATQSLVALVLSATTSLITGFTIAAFQSSFRRYPGLLLFIPPAIGLNGNVFGPLGGRLSTAIRTGTMSWGWRPESVLGQNVLAALASSLGAAVGLAFLAEGFVLLVNTGDTKPIGLTDFIVVAVVGGMLASFIVLAITLALAVASARFGWDLDNVTAPLVSSSGDFITMPALVLATQFIQRGTVTEVLASVLVACAVVAIGLVVRSDFKLCRRIVLESLPILVVAGSLSLVAGLLLERSVSRFLSYTVLLIMLPGYLSAAGALGGILSSRLATKVHLGFVERTMFPSGEALDDIKVTFALAFPLFGYVSLTAAVAGVLFGETSPGAVALLGVCVTGGLVVTTFVAIIAYYATLVVVRFGLDPDNHGIPIVSASLDVVGASTLVGALLVWHVA
jgi:mgtE-like transporter